MGDQIGGDLNRFGSVGLDDAEVDESMAIGPPECFERHCKHYQGIKQIDTTEATEVSFCAAFPDGIPDKIVVGDDLHTQPFPGDNGIRYERED